MPSLCRSDLNSYVRRLYRFLRGGNTIEFKKHRGYRGMCYTQENESLSHVTLDHRDKLLSTLIHEFLHHQHWDWSETEVLNMERKLINALSDRQIRNIIKAFAEVL